MINSACPWGLWLGWIKNSDWPLGQWNGHPAIYRNNVKEATFQNHFQLCWFNIYFSLTSGTKNHFLQFFWEFCIDTDYVFGENTFFCVIEDYFRRVASLTSLTSVRLIVTERFGFTCFDHWFSDYHVIVFGWFRKCDGSGCFLTLRQEKKYGHSYLDLSGF